MEEIYSKSPDFPKRILSGSLFVAAGIFNLMFVLIPRILGGAAIGAFTPTDFFLKLYGFINLFQFNTFISIIFAISGIAFVLLGFLIHMNRNRLFIKTSFIASIMVLIVILSIGIIPSGVLTIGPYLAIAGGIVAMFTKK
jgi:hypothetical protein